ncbi:hypothetical protein PR001_g16529 [Phytophthora rubi]|uniref:Retrotransposon gag domain-containing protein n=1 Tax=Phytophthora rubi TaxID=129364 RepID=A0A6A3KZV5_9STRA|nr:hypothetical protein PR001_g16529 [Phytophthora rubi]
MARETATPGYFTSWSFMEQELRSTFLLANAAYRHRSSFLRCKQGKRSLQDYVMEHHNLEAAMAGAPLSEHVKVTVFMDGVRTGPVPTELFRRQPNTFNEAVHIAMLEDHCVRSAQGHTPHVEAMETQGADAAAARAGRGGSVRAPPTQRVVAGSAHAGKGARVVALATTSGRAGAPACEDKKSDKVTSAPKAEAPSRDADSAAEDKVPQVFDVFTGEPKVGEVLTSLPTVAELLELEEVSYVEFLDSLKAGELAEVVLLCPEGRSLELNSSSVMDPEVLEEERTSKRQTRYGAAILKDFGSVLRPSEGVFGCR